MNKQSFEDYIKPILDNHTVSLDSDDGTTEYGLGDHKELTDTVFRGGDSHLTINEDGEQLGGISFNVEDDVEIEDRDVTLTNNSDATEHLVPEDIAITPNADADKEITHEDIFGEDK